MRRGPRGSPRGPRLGPVDQPTRCRRNSWLRPPVGSNWISGASTAVEALANIGGVRAVEAIVALLKDDDPEIRKLAAEALGKNR